jgi:Acyclic terpene utilisation family protein AtuA
VGNNLPRKTIRIGVGAAWWGDRVEPAALNAEFGWDPLDHVRLGQGSGIGHLMECGAQVTGGYFSDPGFKDVPES